jgi:hypothetical protein
MTALGGAGFWTGKVAIVSTSIEMPGPVEWLKSLFEKFGESPFGNLGAATKVGFGERRRGAANDG